MRTELDVPSVIDQAFDQATPFIHKESEHDYAIMLVTHCGIRIKGRVRTEEAARRLVNTMIAKMKSHPAGGSPTG